MSEWIDINDELPPEGEDVLIIYDCCGEPDIDIMKRHAYRDERRPDIQYENAFMGNRGFLTDDVTHWMKIKPLPAEYQ